MTTVQADLVLSDSVFHAQLNAPLEKVDLAKWLFHLPDAEYRRCAPPDHIAAGANTSDEGLPMSINVEMIGTALMVQHYVGEITEPHHCRLVSDSDVFAPQGRTSVQVVWDLSVTALGEDRCEYTNAVTAHPTDAFLAFLRDHGIPFERAARDRQSASSDHNSRETPRFAASIERAALTGGSDQWAAGAGHRTAAR
ncbi:hypothetical protein GCM10018793_56250 [Streptomyces sulfonofaciens]|uniref:Uncharacterized protein n=1 Tax=Streptomyces sulfonofaciens TaxID=68272 RepID=A0A919L7X2_9ACTN|nr:hypothetical protein [Streptomyces sulfonofaciens]GHH85991.1 hypothetical protein GCM10018793_56250 [Streptomyces sulfonofaciens]